MTFSVHFCEFNSTYRCSVYGVELRTEVNSVSKAKSPLHKHLKGDQKKYFL